MSSGLSVFYKDAKGDGFQATMTLVTGPVGTVGRELLNGLAKDHACH